MSTESPTRNASKPVSGTSAWLPGLDVLRGIAAAAVVVHHSYSLANQPLLSHGNRAEVALGDVIEGLGSWGVDLFFILSGYLLCDYFWRQRRAQRTLRVFWVRRFFRVAPAYYAQVLLLFLFFASPQLLFSRTGLRQVLTQVTFTHWYTPDTASSLNVNGALWTLSIEMTLYLFMPLLALAVGWPAIRGRRTLLWPMLGVAFLIMLGTGYRMFVAFHGGGLQQFYFGSVAPESVANARLYLARQFPAWLPLFALGIGLRWLVTNRYLAERVLAPTRHRLWMYGVLLLPSLAWLLLVQRGVNYTHPFLFSTFDTVLAALLLPPLLYAARPSASSEGGPGIRAGVWLGDRSYGLYLWHFPVILVVYERGTALLPPTLTHPVFRLVTIWVVALGLAMLSYRLVEAPARDYGRALSRRIAARITAKQAADAPAGEPAVRPTPGADAADADRGTPLAAPTAPAGSFAAEAPPAVRPGDDRLSAAAARSAESARAEAKEAL